MTLPGSGAVPLWRARRPHLALRRRNCQRTAVIDAVTHQRIDILADRKSETLEKWLPNNPGVEVVIRGRIGHLCRSDPPCGPPNCRSATVGIYARGLTRSVREVVTAHGQCWTAAGAKRQTLTRETTMLER
ncbi:hypothetical protein ABZW96_37550 [Nocardia sp. NPDC004168]|uniref:hypothetical protein n=1 Tax=Nocardia sp. NPDC004168 TaxID=3154452 RepID=UPI0033AA8001